MVPPSVAMPLQSLSVDAPSMFHKYGHFSPPSLPLRPPQSHVGVYGSFDIMKMFSTRTAFTANEAGVCPMGLWQLVYHLKSRSQVQKSRALQNGSENSMFLYENVVF